MRHIQLQYDWINNLNDEAFLALILSIWSVRKGEIYSGSLWCRNKLKIEETLDSSTTR